MLIPTRSDFVRVRGLRYHVKVTGEAGKPMLWLLPGWLDTAATWAPVAEVLAQQWQVHCPDWRGVGHSEWPQDGYWFYDYVADLDALLAHYTPQQQIPLNPPSLKGEEQQIPPSPPSAKGGILLVGHSMGAQVASLYAGLRPQRVSKLACLDGLFLPDMGPELAPKRFSKWLDELRDEASEMRSYSSFEALAQRVRKQHPQLSDEKTLFVAKSWGYTDGHGKVRLLADPKHYRSGPGLYRVTESLEIWKQITAPTLFLDAGKSLFGQAISAEEKARRRACFRQYEAKVIASAGHMLHFDEPVETARLLTEFFAG